jgi:hypothetical protein
LEYNNINNINNKNNKNNINNINNKNNINNQNNKNNKNILTEVLIEMNNKTSLKEILQTVMKEIFDKGVYLFMKELNINNFVWEEQKTDIDNIMFEEKTNTIYIKKLQYYEIEDLYLDGKMMEDKIKLNFSILKFFGSLIKISFMSEEEKEFLKLKYENTKVPSGEVKIFLSDVINFIASKQKKDEDKIKFVFAKTCQGFEDDTTTCYMSHCFSKLSQILNTNDSYNEKNGIFNQTDLKILVEILNFVAPHVKDDKYNLPFDEKLNDIYFSVQCVMHSLKIKNPDVLARNFIYFTNKNYRGRHIKNS